MDFSNYKFRCSSLGKLMTNGKDCLTDKQLELIAVFENKEKLTVKQLEKLKDLKNRRDNPGLSETTKSYLLEIYIEEIYGRSRDISNKYTEKGIYTEEDSLDLMSEYYEKLILKNKKSFENEYVKGTPDVLTSVEIHDDRGIVLTPKILDAKSSWDIWTFFEADGNNRDYYWQGQGYMYLTGAKYFDLVYCLNNAPEHLIIDEKTRQMFKRGLVGMEGSPEFDAMEVAIEKNMKFDDIAKEKRIKVFAFNYEPEAITQLQKRIGECRNYLNSINL